MQGATIQWLFVFYSSRFFERGTTEVKTCRCLLKLIILIVIERC